LEIGNVSEVRCQLREIRRILPLLDRAVHEESRPADALGTHAADATDCTYGIAGDSGQQGQEIAWVRQSLQYLKIIFDGDKDNFKEVAER